MKLLTLSSLAYIISGQSTFRRPHFEIDIVLKGEDDSFIGTILDNHVFGFVDTFGRWNAKSGDSIYIHFTDLQAHYYTITKQQKFNGNYWVVSTNTELLVTANAKLKLRTCADLTSQLKEGMKMHYVYHLSNENHTVNPLTLHISNQPDLSCKDSNDYNFCSFHDQTSSLEFAENHLYDHSEFTFVQFGEKIEGRVVAILSVRDNSKYREHGANGEFLYPTWSEPEEISLVWHCRPTDGGPIDLDPIFFTNWILIFSCIAVGIILLVLLVGFVLFCLKDRQNIRGVLVDTTEVDVEAGLEESSKRKFESSFSFEPSDTKKKAFDLFNNTPGRQEAFPTGEPEEMLMSEMKHGKGSQEKQRPGGNDGSKSARSHSEKKRRPGGNDGSARSHSEKKRRPGGNDGNKSARSHNEKKRRPGGNDGNKRERKKSI